MPCDTGSPRETIENEFNINRIEEEGFGLKSMLLDLTNVGPDWYIKSGTNAPDSDSLQQRAKFVLDWIDKRPEQDIIIVSHGGKLDNDSVSYLANHDRLSVSSNECKTRMDECRDEEFSSDTQE